MSAFRYIQIRLRGSSMPEVLIALSITSVCICLALIIYLNIQKSSLPFLKLKAMELAEKHMKEAMTNRSRSDESFKEEAFTVRRTVEGSPLLPDCSVIRIIVFDGTKQKLCELESTVTK